MPANVHCSFGICKSDNRYPKAGVTFFPFPKPCTAFRISKYSRFYNTNLNYDIETVHKFVKEHISTCSVCDRCERWVWNCKRKDLKFNSISDIRKDTVICSEHFPSGISRNDLVNCLPRETKNMRKKSDGTSKSNLVRCSINDLLVNKAEYITTGVPPEILLSKITDELCVITGETDFDKNKSKAKQLIDNEINNETLVCFPSGNYFHGPRKSDVARTANLSGDESDSLHTTPDDEDEDEDDDDAQGKNDEDYQPQGYLTSSFKAKREGRTSARMKKSRFDSDEYIFPKNLQKLNKTRTSPTTPSKAPRRKPGPKPKKRPMSNLCSLCRNTGSETELSNTCKSCPTRAHYACVEKEMKGEPISDWSCLYCKPPTPSKLKCAVCGNAPGKDMGILVTCDSCQRRYHRTCHRPSIEARNLKSWRCSSCPQKSPGRGVKRAEKPENAEVKVEADYELKSKKSIPYDACDKCELKFPNPVDKLVCVSCKKAFHSRCCRVRDVSNIMRLGARKSKWRCDGCKLHKGRFSDSCRVVIPRLRLDDDSSEEGNSCSSKFNREQQQQQKPRQLKTQNSAKAGVDGSKLDDNSYVDVEDEDSNSESKDANATMEDKNDWWTARLRPIVVGEHQPPLGLIPDPSVPDVTTWTCLDVQKYFNEYFVDRAIGRIFLDQDIDGKALKLMRRVDILTTFDSAGVKLDSILEVMPHIKRLQLRVNDIRYIWADLF